MSQTSANKRRSFRNKLKHTQHSTAQHGTTKQSLGPAKAAALAEQPWRWQLCEPLSPLVPLLGPPPGNANGVLASGKIKQEV